LLGCGFICSLKPNPKVIVITPSVALAVWLPQPYHNWWLGRTSQYRPNLASVLNAGLLAAMVANDKLLPQPDSLASTDAALIFGDWIISD
jgi:hypothetical protein